MLTLLLIIFLALTIFLSICAVRNDWAFELTALSVLAGIISLALLISVTFQCYQVFCRANTIAAEIQLYEEENNKIEEKINTVVQEYLEHEKTTYEEIKPENVIAALSMFPELNSSDLVKKEIEIYQTNQDKLISLKEEQITGIPTARFLLYFGN